MRYGLLHLNFPPQKESTGNVLMNKTKPEARLTYQVSLN